MARRQPIIALSDLRLRRESIPETTDMDAAKRLWRGALQEASMLWYTRRRNIQYKADIVGLPAPLIRDESETEEKVQELIAETAIIEDFETVNSRGTVAAKAEIMSLLSAPTFIKGSPILVKAAVREMATTARDLDEDKKVNRFTVLKISERFSETKFGEGIARLEQVDPTFKESEVIVNTMSNSGKVPELDRLVRALPDDKLRLFSKELKTTAESGDGDRPQNVARLVEDKLKEIKTPSLVFGLIR